MKKRLSTLHGYERIFKVYNTTKKINGDHIRRTKLTQGEKCKSDERVSSPVTPLYVVHIENSIGPNPTNKKDCFC